MENNTKGFEYLLEINERTEECDLKKMASFATERKPGQMRTIAVAAAVFALVLILCEIFVEGMENTALSIAGLLLFMAIIGIFIQYSSRRRVIKQYRKNGELGIVRTLRFGKESVEVISSSGRGIYLYSDIALLCEDKNYIFLRMPGNHYLPIIMRYVDAQQLSLLQNIFSAYEADHKLKHVIINKPLAAQSPVLVEPQKGIQLEEKAAPLANLRYRLTPEQIKRATRKAGSGKVIYIVLVVLLAIALISLALGWESGELSGAIGMLIVILILLVVFERAKQVALKNNLRVLGGELHLALYENEMIESFDNGEISQSYADIKRVVDSGDIYVIINKANQFSVLDANAAEQNAEYIKLFTEKLGDRIKNKK